jgi:hypothetical protein
MKAIDISLVQLKLPPCTDRWCRSEARVAGLARSLEAEGQKVPLIVYPEAGGEAVYLVLSGATRLEAARRLGWTSLRAEVDESLALADEASLFKASRACNDAMPVGDIDRAYSARYLHGKGMALGRIADVLGCSVREVSRLKAFWALPESLLAQGGEHPEKFSSAMAEELCKALQLFGEEKTLEYAARLFAGNLHLRELQRILRAEATRQGREGGPKKILEQAFSLPGEEGAAGVLRIRQMPNGTHQIQFSAELEAVHGERLRQGLAEFLAAFAEEAAGGGDA